jgi:hypothetical protein
MATQMQSLSRWNASKIALLKTRRISLHSQFCTPRRVDLERWLLCLTSESNTLSSRSPQRLENEKDTSLTCVTELGFVKIDTLRTTVSIDGIPQDMQIFDVFPLQSCYKANICKPN